MAGAPKYYYWDSCVFLAYLSVEPTRSPIVEALLEEVARSKSRRIITSSLSICEVAYVANQRAKRLTHAEMDERIDDLWRARHIEIVDASRGLMMKARELVRSKISPPDAIHMTTAMWVNQSKGGVLEIHTYDDKWGKNARLLSGLHVCEPHTEQLILPFGADQA